MQEKPEVVPRPRPRTCSLTDQQNIPGQGEIMKLLVASCWPFPHVYHPVYTVILTISHFIVYSLMVSAVANGKWSNWWLNLGKILCTCFNVSCPVPKSLLYYVLWRRLYKKIHKGPSIPCPGPIKSLRPTPLQTGHCSQHNTGHHLVMVMGSPSF